MMEKKESLPNWLQRGMVDLFPNNDKDQSDNSLASSLDQSLINKRPLRVKLGIDPTSTNIHLGHSLLFKKLRAFQDAGHTAILIIGDFTARIGDPTGKSKTRIQLSVEDVTNNSKTYLKQLGQGKPKEESILDFSTPGRLEIHYNSKWLENITFNQTIDLLSTATLGQMIAKEDFGNRYAQGVPIALHEFLYPLMQAYDSVAIKADLELGGTDQKFNIAMGRDLQKHFKQSQQFGLLMPILIGLDGVQKMSKSIGNTINIDEDPLSMYSKLEKIPDSLVEDYITLLTDLKKENLTSNPRELQKKMALEITASFHGYEKAKAAQSDASKLISGVKESSGSIPSASLSNVNFPAKVFYILSTIGLCKTSSEARRHIQGGAVRLDGKKVTDPNLQFDVKEELLGKVIQLGKNNFRLLTI